MVSPEGTEKAADCNMRTKLVNPTKRLPNVMPTSDRHQQTPQSSGSPQLQQHKKSSSQNNNKNQDSNDDGSNDYSHHRNIHIPKPSVSANFVHLFCHNYHEMLKLHHLDEPPFLSFVTAAVKFEHNYPFDLSTCNAAFPISFLIPQYASLQWVHLSLIAKYLSLIFEL